MVYQMAATAMTLNDLQGYSKIACFFKCNPSNIYAALYTNSTYSVLAVPLRQPNFPCESGDYTDKRIVYARNTESGQ